LLIFQQGFFFNQDGKMKLLPTIALGFAAAALWNCNDATQPESRAVDKRVPAMVNSVANYAAYSAGLQSLEVKAMGPVEDTSDEENPFGPEGLQALEAVGLCPNFFLIVQELVQNLQSMDPQSNANPFEASPHLMEAFQCLESKSQGFSTVAPTPAEAIGIIDQCLCAGSGTLFGNFLFATYGAPKVPGGGYSSPRVPGVYAAPRIQGYSAPAVPGKGYAAPSL
jgi:hypothetical protein